MKKLLIILLLLSSNAFAWFWGEDTTKQDETDRQIEAAIAQAKAKKSLESLDGKKVKVVEDSNQTVVDNNSSGESMDSNIAGEDSNDTTLWDENITTADANSSVWDVKGTEELQERKLSDFEKKFVNHIAYNHYKKAIKLLYEKEQISAYKEAYKAKEFFDNSLDNRDIVLPYMPGYLRESAQTPKRIYYKILVERDYELTRLIRKIKLLNPPIPLVVLNQTSTYIDITINNSGEVPLDNFVIEVNYEKVAEFDRVYPNQSQTYRYNQSVLIEEISFSEAYGFAPAAIELSNE